VLWQCLVLGLLLGLEAVGSDLLVVLLEGSEILTSLSELAFLHTLADIPVDESALAVHEVKLVIKTRPGLSNGGGVGKHRYRAVDSSKTAIARSSRDSHRLLVVDAELETSGTPLNEVEGGLSLESGNGSVAVTGNSVTTVQESNSHVLSVARVANNHLVVWLEALEGQIMNLEALMVLLGGRDDGSIADERVVDARIWDQVSLELVEIDVESAIEAERRGDGADNLGDQAIQVIVRRARDVQTAAADVIDSLVINKERAVRVLDGAVGRENGVVGLNNGSGCARSRVHGELELGLLAVLGRKALQKESAESRTRATTKGVENQETLKRVAAV
jgi:hypothetical protein